MGQANQKPAKMVDQINKRIADLGEFRNGRLEQKARLRANLETIQNQLVTVGNEIAATIERENELRALLAMTGSEQPETPTASLPHKEAVEDPVATEDAPKTE